MESPLVSRTEGQSCGDWTRLELFLGGIRTLTLQLSIGKIEAACGAGKSSCGESLCSRKPSLILTETESVRRHRLATNHASQQ